ncbi:bifunctional lytic transglycosylase/C40 family peptidase [Bacillus toyonensis]|uniref:NlpC/P60 domain-containing protein n=1 Tax=Bacillus toyonensis TaxID=155322 RepID=A0A2A8HE14_9BACI|nr:bifunctional lytic transglycosylase/C40 family peptidase [Bacillus toyonensis]PEQ04858.1 hypothetical protein CN585_16690 [Bacillus toyonensis]
MKKKTSNQSNSNFRQQESVMKELDKNVETTEQGALQKESFKPLQHTNQKFQQQKNTVKVLHKRFEAAEQKQILQTTHTIEGPQEIGQQTLQKQGSKLLQHTDQEMYQQHSIVKASSNKFKKIGYENIRETKNIIEDLHEVSYGKLQKKPLNQLQHNDQKIPLQKQEFKRLNHTNQEFRQQDRIKDGKKQGILKTPQQEKMEESPLKEDGRNSKKLLTTHPKVQKGLQFIGKLGRHSLIATKTEVTNSLTSAKNTLKYGAKTLGSSTKNGLKKYQQTLEQDDQGVRVASQGATKGYRISKKGFRKLRQRRQKKLYVKRLKKEKIEILQKRKMTKESNLKEIRLKGLDKQITLKRLAKVPARGLGNGALKYQEQLEQDDEGVKLASQSTTKIARATKKLMKNKMKANATLGKMGKQQSKLVPFPHDKKLQVESRAILEKKSMKKKLYAPLREKNKTRDFTGLVSNIKNQVVTLFKNVTTFNFKNATNLVGTRVAAIFCGGLVATWSLLFVGIICLIMAGMSGAGVSSQKQIDGNIGGTRNLSPEVENWRPLVEKEAAAQGMESYVSLLLAIIQVESGGTGTRDIMQSSESAGYGRPNVFQTEEESVRQGVKHLKECLLALKAFNMGYENNIKALAQAYNYGNYFATWLGKRGGEYSLEVAEEYSRTVVAPSLGNTTGRTMPYVNETSMRLGKPYKYVDGGNFFYGELINEYIGGSGANISGDFQTVLAKIEKYQGWPYVWGGKNPNQGFDCSGLTSWGLKQIGIDLPSYALSQYELTEPINPSKARPGDLIFFKGTYQSPDHISHVGFYIDESTMYDSQASGIGYHNWKLPYWQQHFAGIHRVKR